MTRIGTIGRTVSLAVFGLMLVVGLSMQASGQTATSSPTRNVPSLPGAVERPPDWLLADKSVPFDVKAYFALPPASQNAAALYLDALFEFSEELSVCFPRSPEADARARKALDRSHRLEPLARKLHGNTLDIDRSEIRALLPEYQEGFQKLAEAQRRPGCVFVQGFRFADPIPHLKTSARVSQVAMLAVLALLQEGNLDGALGYAAGNLRLARDLQRRGVPLNDIVSAGLTFMTVFRIAEPTLRHSNITVSQCDQWLRLLADHEKKLIDGYSEGLKGQYVLVRTTLHELADRTGGSRRSGGHPMREELIEQLSQPTDRSDEEKRLQSSLKQTLARATPREYSQAVAELNRLYRDLLAGAKEPFPRRVVKANALLRQFPRTTGPEQVIVLMSPPLTLLDEAINRAEAMIHMIEALAAVRRWQLVHHAPPTDLAAACREAKLPGVPGDPYAGGQPVKYVVLNGVPGVYSVGKDGRDDGGRLDSKNNTQRGDLIFRLIPLAELPAQYR